MTFDFTVKEFILGGGTGTPTFTFYRRGFNLGGSAQPSWKDVVISGIGSLTLVNAKANGLNYLKLFGGTELVPETYIDSVTLEGKCEQNGTPTPTNPVDIVCNNGVLGIDNQGNITVTGTVETVTDSNQLTATAQPLLSAGDYKDTQEVLSGAITRNMGIKVIDGTENWQFVNTAYSDGTHRIYCNELFLPAGNSSLEVISGYCTHFPINIITNRDVMNLGACIMWSVQGSVHLRATQFTTLEVAKQWLAQQYANGTPVIVVYPLKTATTETVTGQQLNKEPVTVTGSLTGLVANVVSSSHTTPTPTQPLDIVANNGVIKLSPNLINESMLVKVSATIWRYYSTVSQGGFDLKANTTYTLSTDDSNINVYFYDYDTKTSIASGKHTKTYTPTEDTKVYFTLYLSSGIPEDTHIQLEIGSTATTYRPYGSVYYDGTVETVATKQTYVSDSDIVDRTGLNSSNGATISNANRCYVLFPCKAGVTYTAQTDTADLIGGNFIEYRQPNAISANFIKSITATDDGLVGGVYKFHAVCDTDGWAGWQCKSNKDTALANNWQITSDISTATAQPLLKVGDYKDEQNVTSGAITRNVRVKVLDGTEDWVKPAGSDYFRLDGMFKDAIPYSSDNPAIVCSHFVGRQPRTSASNMNDKDIKLGYTSVYNRLYLKYNDMTSADDLKTWLAEQYANGTPVIVVYPLATPTTETVTGQPMTIQAGTNVVAITQASIDNLELEVSYKAGVEVTVEEIEAVNNDESVEVTING